MKRITVAVHNGVFHADDAFAVATLRRITDVSVVRSRRPDVLVSADLRVDVGDSYDPDQGTFDHHQRGGAGCRKNGVPYAGFGLVWKHYGVEACKGDADVAWLVDEELVQSVDAADCGFSLLGGETAKGVRPYSVSTAVSAMNPGWDEPADFDAAFERAVEFVGLILDRAIARAAGVVRAKVMVRQAIAKAADQRVLVLDTFCPWQEVVIDEAPETLFVLFPSETGDWRIQCVPDAPGSFGKRRPLPEAWAGKRGDELVALTGVADAIFCHPGRFIAGAVSRESILRLAELALG